MTVSGRYYIIGILQFYRKNHITVQIKGSNYMHFEKRTARNRKYRKFLHSRQQNLMLLGVFVFVISIVCGCSNQKEQESDGSLQKITVGIDKFEPYSYLDMDGNYTGVDIEIASKVFHELGYEPDFKFITWSEKHTCLADGTIDCIWSCYSMNDRENDYQWAGPYLYSRQVIAVASDSDIQTFDDLLGKNVGVQDTTRAAELFFHTIDSALPEVKQVNCFATTEDMFAALRKGYVDAIAGHEALLNELIINGKGKYRLLDESPYISKIGIAFQKGTHEELTQKINGLIKEMSEDGTIGSIAEKYGLDAEKVVIRGGSDEK